MFELGSGVLSVNWAVFFASYFVFFNRNNVTNTMHALYCVLKMWCMNSVRPTWVRPAPNSAGNKGHTGHCCGRMDGQMEKFHKVQDIFSLQISAQPQRSNPLSFPLLSTDNRQTSPQSVSHEAMATSKEASGDKQVRLVRPRSNRNSLPHSYAVS